MKNIPWAHDKNVSKTLSFPWRDAIKGKISALEGGMHPKESGAKHAN
jgi:hypothetical protein